MRINYIENIDCLEGLKEVPDGSVDLIVTDPPYRLVSGGYNGMGGMLSKANPFATTGELFRHNGTPFADWLPEAYRVLKANSHCYIMTNSRNLLELWQACEKSGLAFQSLLVWDKGNVTPSRYYMNAFELILMLRKGKAKTINNRGDKNILRVKNSIGEKRHPTEKPVDLMEVFVKNSTGKGDVVLDPFMGSGTTAVACIKTGRNFIGFELDEGYHAIAQKRISETIDQMLNEEGEV